MIAFHVPTGRLELIEARFFGYPLHVAGGFREGESLSDCSKVCPGCAANRADHDPGDEHDAIERIAAASGEGLERIASVLAGLRRYIEPDEDLRARVRKALAP